MNEELNEQTKVSMDFILNQLHSGLALFDLVIRSYSAKQKKDVKKLLMSKIQEFFEEIGKDNNYH